MSAAAKVQSINESDPVLPRIERRGFARGRVARDFALLLGGALAIGVVAGVGMMLAVLLIA